MNNSMNAYPLLPPRGFAGFLRRAVAMLGLLALTLATLLPLPASAQPGRGEPHKDWWVDITNDRVDAVRAALRRGTDPNALSPDGYPSLMLAIREQSWGVYDLLAAQPGIIRNAINLHKETALMYLAVMGETKRARALINAGALVNLPEGWTPLHYAVSKGHTDTATMLIERGAEVNAPGPDGVSPLMMAAYGGSEPSVRLLLEHGADVSVRDRWGRQAQDWAMMKQHTRLARSIDTLHQEIAARRAAPPAPRAEAARAEPSKKAAPPSEADTSRYFDPDRRSEIWKH